jgi:hypothetical protein
MVAGFGTPPAGPRKFEANMGRRTRLVVEVWIEMNTFGQLCQGLKPASSRRISRVSPWVICIGFVPVSSTRDGWL